MFTLIVELVKLVVLEYLKMRDDECDCVGMWLNVLVSKIIYPNLIKGEGIIVFRIFKVAIYVFFSWRVPTSLTTKAPCPTPV